MTKNVKINGRLRKILIIILSCVLIVSIICIVVIKYTRYLDNKKQEEISRVLDTIEIPEEKTQEVAEEIKTKRMLQVETLKKENSDIVGWLEIEGTNINYPILQGKDNDYYLTHNYKGEKIYGGSLFLDKDYDFSIPSTNLLIYGHRNEKGLMFEDLIKYQDEEFYKKHTKIRFTTENEDYEYEIISVFKSRIYYQNEKNVFRYYYFLNANNENEYNTFVNNCKSISLYDTGKTAIYGEQLLTLSTCEYSKENGRFAVIAKKANNVD